MPAVSRMLTSMESSSLYPGLDGLRVAKTADLSTVLTFGEKGGATHAFRRSFSDSSLHSQRQRVNFWLPSNGDALDGPVRFEPNEDTTRVLGGTSHLRPGQITHVSAIMEDPSLDNVNNMVMRGFVDSKGYLAVEDIWSLASLGVLQRIPIDEQGKLSSVGSMYHANRECTPCIPWSHGACRRGIACSLCHLEHRCSLQCRSSRMRIRLFPEDGPNLEADA